MSLSRKAKAAKTLVDVRAVQHLSAQGELERRAAAVRALEAKQEDKTAEQARTQNAWAASVAGPTLRIDVVGAWSQAVLIGQEALQALGQEVAEANSYKQDALGVWQLAQAKLDAAQTFEKTASRRLRRHQEEIAAGAAADRAIQNWVAR